MTPELWQRLKRLYSTAIELRGADREQCIAEACGTDAELRKEIEALLKATDESTLPGSGPFVNLEDVFPRLKNSFSEGELVLGRFQIVRHLGTGGMGEVYEATDLELGSIALKTIRPDIAVRQECLLRFNKEVQLARRISSLHVCRIHELFPMDREASRSHPAFLTMEFLEGITLADKIGLAGPLSWRETKSIGLEICAGLQAIHEAGIIHRDLKCQNIMLASRSGNACVVLMDFGVAHELSRSPNAQITGLTRDGAIIGSPNYMAPEQFEGAALSPATDIYAVGVVLYETLTGEHPFAGTTLLAAAVRRGRRLKSVTSIQPRLSHEWDDVIGKCLEFKAEDRYQSASELRTHLELLHPSGIKLLYTRACYPVRRLRKISPLRLSLSVLFTSIVITVAVFVGWRFYPRVQPFTSLSMDQVTDSGDITNFALAADGKTLAMVRSAGGQNSIWLRNISTMTDVEILPPVSLTYGSLVFSRDGNQLYFARQDEDNPAKFNLYKSSVLGGDPALAIRDVSDKVSLSKDEKRLAYLRLSDASSELHVITLANGQDDAILKVAGNVYSSLAWSPNGRWLAFWSPWKAWPARSAMTIFDPKSKEKREVLLPASIRPPEDAALEWMPSGRQLLLSVFRMFSGVVSPGEQIGLLTISTGDVRQLTNDPVDHVGLALSSDAKTIATILRRRNSEIRFYDAKTASLLSFTHLPVSFDDLAWLDEEKLLTFFPSAGTVRFDVGEYKDLELVPPPGTHNYQTWDMPPAVCPDGGFILQAAFNGVEQLCMINSHGHFVNTLIKIEGPGSAFCDAKSKLMYYSVFSSSNTSIWRLSPAGGNPRRLTAKPGYDRVVYSSDGKFAAYMSEDTRHSTARIVRLDDGTVARDIFLVNRAKTTLVHFTPDRSALGFVEQGPQGFALARQPTDGSAPRLLTPWYRDQIADFAWSPSGKILAIMGDSSTFDVALITEKSSKPSK